MAKPNVRYGNGVFRRRIRLRADAGRVTVELEDGNHGFRLRLHHDGHTVTGIDADTLRHPFGTCAEAVLHAITIILQPCANKASVIAKLKVRTSSSVRGP